MRALWLPLVLVLAAPALAAASVTETIALKSISAPEAEQILLQGRPRPDFRSSRDESGRLGNLEAFNWNRPPSRWPDIIPSGLIALSVDSHANTLSVTGTPEAIDRLRDIVRQIDVPARQVRMTVELIQLKPEDWTRLSPKVEGADLAVTSGSADSESLKVAALGAKQVQELLAGAERRYGTVAMISSRVRPAYVFMPAEADLTGQITILPRVNGDGTVTPLVDHEFKVSGTVATVHSTIARKLAVGESLAFYYPAFKLAAVIRPELLPDPAPAKQP